MVQIHRYGPLTKKVAGLRHGDYRSLEIIRLAPLRPSQSLYVHWNGTDLYLALCAASNSSPSKGLVTR